MNLAESMKHVLRTRGSGLFSDFWREDLRLMASDLKQDVKNLGSAGLSRVRSLKQRPFKETFVEVRNSAVDTALIFRVIPIRIRDAFTFFQEDVLKELEALPDARMRAVFGIKVMGALGGTALSFFYGLKRARQQISFKGIRIRNAFTYYILAELVFKVSQVFILRFLYEVEKELSNEQDKKNVKFFRDLISDDARLADPKILEEDSSVAGDRAVEIVESLKFYILTGKRSE